MKKHFFLGYSMNQRKSFSYAEQNDSLGITLTLIVVYFIKSTSKMKHMLINMVAYIDIALFSPFTHWNSATEMQ